MAQASSSEGPRPKKASSYTPRFLRLKKAAPKKSPRKSARGGAATPRSILASSRDNSCASPSSLSSEDMQQGSLLRAMLTLSQRFRSSQEPPQKPNGVGTQHSPPVGLTALSPLPPFEKIVPHHLPYPADPSGRCRLWEGTCENSLTANVQTVIM